MLEKRHEPLAPRFEFIIRVVRFVGVGLFLITVALGIGMLGYRYFEGMSWVDAFANAAMILSGMGPFGPLTTKGGKIFAGFYALFSGLAFISIIGLIFVPVVHRFIHKYHLADDK